MTQGRTACRWHIRAGENETKRDPCVFPQAFGQQDGLARILNAGSGLDTEDKLSHFYTMTYRIYQILS